MANKYLDFSGLQHFVDQLKTFIKGNVTHYGTCVTAAATAAKEISTDGDFILRVGAIVSAKFTYSNTASNPTINVNGTGAKPVWYGTAVVTTSSLTAAGNAKIITTYIYDGTNWVWVSHSQDNNTNTTPIYLEHRNYILAKTAITAESVIVGDSLGYSRVASGVAFDISYPIVWCTKALSANGSNYANMFLCHYDRNIATGAKSGFTSAKNKVIYLVVTIVGNVATIDSTIITDTLPSSEDGKVYIVLGKLGNQSTGANYFIFYPEHPMFWYKDGAIRPYGTTTHSILSDVPANAVFTDTTYSVATSSADGLMSSTDKANLDALQPSGVIASCDLDTLTYTMVGQIITANTYTNAPTTAGILEVVTSGTESNQLVQRIYNGTSMYYRYKSGTAFSSWMKVTATQA